eukprot:gene12009-5409_t
MSEPTEVRPEDDAIKHYRNKQRNDKKKIFEGIRSQEVLLTLEEIQNSEFDETMKSKKLCAGTAEMQGRRKTMEDADTNVVYYRGTEDESFFGVYDGHAGSDCSKLIGENLHKIFDKKLTKYYQYMKDLEEEKESKINGSEELIPYLREWLCKASVKYDPKIKDKTRTTYRRDSMVEKPNFIEDSYETIEIETLLEDEAIQVLLRESFFEMSELVKEKKLQDGATAAVVYIKGTKCYVANAGDSRVVISRDGKAHRLSVDHKPDDDSEKRRIREVGGFVADGRVNGIMGVSRAIGDNFLDPMIIHDPFTKVIDLNEKDNFIIIACDGVWDVVSDSDAVKEIQEEKDPRVASAKLRNYAYDNKSTDNITCTVVRFLQFCK